MNLTTMRRVVTFIGVAVSVVAIGLLVHELRTPYFSPAGEAGVAQTNPSPPKQPRSSGSGGVVIANDESPDSQPHQHVAHEPANQRPAKTELNPTEKLVTINDKQYPLRTYKALATPNDPLAEQWWVDRATVASSWDMPAGEHQTVLAVIDTGFALEHEEFTDRWYANPDESGPAIAENPSKLNCTDQALPLTASCNLIDDNRDGLVDNETGSVLYENPSKLNCTDQALPLTKSCNMIDDDSNGYVDDVRGWDFINNDYSVQAGELNSSGEGTTHGTLVAGVAAASGDNTVGIAGVDWDTKILPLQALDDDSYGDTLSVGQAIFYAVSQNVDVINISLGTEFHDPYVLEAIEAANAAGIAVVASAGNDGCDCVLYPANYQEVVAVGALNESDQLASFSSWGSSLDLLAPGTNLTSPTWVSGNQTSAYTSGIDGTSFAAPMVAGVLTRVLSHQPDAVPLQIAAALSENTDRLELPDSTPHSKTYGHGLLDANRTLSRMTVADAPAILYTFMPVSTGTYFDEVRSAEIGDSHMYQCAQNVIATTPIYEVSKNGARFFSVSNAEVRQAKNDGYKATVFSRVCVRQPHDIADIIRRLNLFGEFRIPKPQTEDLG